MSEKADKQKKPTRLLIGSVIIIGVMGGLFFSTFAVILYLFNFSEISAATYILDPWLQRDWTDQWQGHLLSIILAGIISIIPSILYYLLFKKLNTMWVGVFFGIILWAVMIFALLPFLHVTQPITELTMETFITTLAVFILYGTFIGYSIAYDYYDMQAKASEGKLDELKTEL